MVTSTNANFKSVINIIAAGYRRFKLKTTPIINNLHIQTNKQLHRASIQLDLILANYDGITIFNRTLVAINF